MSVSLLDVGTNWPFNKSPPLVNCLSQCSRASFGGEQPKKVKVHRSVVVGIGKTDLAEKIQEPVGSFAEVKNRFKRLFEFKGLSEHIGYRFIEVTGVLFLQLGIDQFFAYAAIHVGSGILLSPYFEMFVDQAIFSLITGFCLAWPLIYYLFNLEGKMGFASSSSTHREANLQASPKSTGEDAEDMATPTNAESLPQKPPSWEKWAFDGVKNFLEYIDQPVPKCFYGLRNGCAVGAVCFCLASMVLINSGHGIMAVYVGIWVLRLVISPTVAALSRIVGPTVDKMLVKTGDKIQARSSLTQSFWLLVNAMVLPVCSWSLDYIFYVAKVWLGLTSMVQGVLIGVLLLVGVGLIYIASYKIWNNFLQIREAEATARDNLLRVTPVYEEALGFRQKRNQLELIKIQSNASSAQRSDSKLNESGAFLQAEGLINLDEKLYVVAMESRSRKTLRRTLSDSSLGYSMLDGAIHLIPVLNDQLQHGEAQGGGGSKEEALEAAQQMAGL